MRFFINPFVWIWWRLPLSRQGKEKLKGFVFKSIPWLFKNSKTYKNWKYTNSLLNPNFNYKPESFPPDWPIDKLDNIDKYNASDLNVSNQTNKIAVVIHAFYEELFKEIVVYIKKLPEVNCKLFVSTISEKKRLVEEIAEKSGLPYEIEVFENKGRDILPFLKLSEKAIHQAYPLILKLHTKKSDHRLTGSLWRKDIYTKLLDNRNFLNIIELFRNCPNVGLIGPEGHIVPMSLYYGSNAQMIGYFAYRMNIPPQILGKLHFIAGTMFYIKSKALLPLISMQLNDAMFEEEGGQDDGTMAHAIERAFSLSNSAAGFIIADNNTSPDKIEHSVTLNHPFTW